MIPVTVTFYGDVGFDRSYMNVIDFNTTTERDNYFNPRIVKTIQNCAYNKPMNSLQIVCDYSDALAFTYCKFNIGSKTGKGKEIYAWVDDVVLVTDQPNEEGTTYNSILSVNISIDPWQTFLFDFSLGESFVAREHRDRFKPNSDGTYGWCLPNVATDDNVGVKRIVEDICDLSPVVHYTEGDSRTNWLVIQFVQGGAHEMLTYVVPVSNGRNKVTNGVGLAYTLSYEDLYTDEYLSILEIDPEGVSSVYFLPFDIASHSNQTLVWEQVSYTVDVPELLFEESHFTPGRKYNNTLRMGFLYFYANIGYDDFPNVLQFSKQTSITDNIVVPSGGDYKQSSEPQLYKSPYKVISVIDENGIIVGNLPDICSNITNGYSSIKIQLLIDSVEVRVRIKPDTAISMTDRFWVEFIPASVDVLRNNWLSYFLQQRDADRTMIRSQINQQAIASAISMVGGSVNMGAGQAMSVGKSQAGGSQAAMGMSEGGAFAAGALVGLGVGAIATIGGFIANEHYAFEQQDIREGAIQCKANNVIMSGSFKSLINRLRIVRVVCDDTTIDIKSKEYHKYGYAIQGFETPNTKTRKYFNFLATTICKIEGSLNNNVKMALAQIFDNGVTIWHGDYISELSGIGDYSKENIERRLI